MNLAALSARELRERLRGPGLNLCTPPYQLRLYSDFERLACALQQLYGDYSLHDNACPDFVIQVKRSGGWRRWWRPQVRFFLDEREPFKPLPADQAHAMFEWGLNWCIYNHDHTHLLLHAAVLERNGKALVLPGMPGAGKSTLTASLQREGFRLLSDELCRVTADGAYITPIPRPVSLKNASIPLLQNRYPNAVLTEPARDTNKGTVAHLRIDESALCRATENARAHCILFPRYVAGSEWQCREMHRAETLLHAVQQSFNLNLIGESGFDAAVNLVRQSQCYVMQYSDLDDAVLRLKNLMDSTSCPA